MFLFPLEISHYLLSFCSVSDLQALYNTSTEIRSLISSLVEIREEEVGYGITCHALQCLTRVKKVRGIPIIWEFDVQRSHEESLHEYAVSPISRLEGQISIRIVSIEDGSNPPVSIWETKKGSEKLLEIVPEFLLSRIQKYPEDQVTITYGEWYEWSYQKEISHIYHLKIIFADVYHESFRCQQMGNKYRSLINLLHHTKGKITKITFHREIVNLEVCPLPCECSSVFSESGVEFRFSTLPVRHLILDNRTPSFHLFSCGGLSSTLERVSFVSLSRPMFDSYDSLICSAYDNSWERHLVSHINMLNASSGDTIYKNIRDIDGLFFPPHRTDLMGNFVRKYPNIQTIRILFLITNEGKTLEPIPFPKENFTSRLHIYLNNLSSLYPSINFTFFIV